jgi:hypothetical protein
MKAKYRVAIWMISLLAMAPARGADAVLWSEDFDSGTEGQSITAAPFQWTPVSADPGDPTNPAALADFFLAPDLHPGWTGLAVDGSSSVRGLCHWEPSARGDGYVRKDIGNLLPSHGIITLSAKMWADPNQTEAGLLWINKAGSWMMLSFLSEYHQWIIDVRGYAWDDSVIFAPRGIGENMTVIGTIYTDLDNVEAWAVLADAASGLPIWTSGRQALNPAKLHLEMVYIWQNRCENYGFGTDAGMDIDDIVVTGPATVAPPSNLACSEEPVRKVVLGWTNGEAYDRIEVYRDGTDAGSLVAGDVTGQSFTDTAVPVGDHTYRIRGIAGGATSPFAGPCSVTVPLETDFFLHIDDVSGKKGAEVDATVRLDFDHIAADPPPGNIQGWSYGICNDVGVVEPLEITTQGTDTGGLNGGAGPEFQSLNVFPGGITVEMIVDTDNVETIPPSNGWSDVRIRYKLTGTGLDCASIPDPLSGRLRACDTLGSPSVPSIATIETTSLPASGSDGGAVQIGCSSQYFLSLETVEGVGNDEGRLDVVIDFNHDGTNTGQIQGWAYGLCHDPEILEAGSIEAAPDSLGLNGGAGPDFFVLDAYDGGITVVAVVDTNAQVTVPPQNGWRDTVVSYFLVDRSGECFLHPGTVVTAQVRPCSSLGKPGKPPVLSVMTIASKSVPLGGYEIGALDIRCGPLFVRGDANGDQQFDVSDPITALSHLFLGLPVGCRDAVDANDDGVTDISDGIYILGFLFLGGGSPPAPYPQEGRDPTPDAVDCQEYPAGE